MLGLPPLVQQGEGGGEVRLAWRPPNLCVLSHIVKVWASQDLSHPLSLFVVIIDLFVFERELSNFSSVTNFTQVDT